MSKSGAAANKTTTVNDKYACAVFTDKLEQSIPPEPPKFSLNKPATEPGKKVRLSTNIFSIVPSSDCAFYHYHYFVHPRCEKLEQDKQVIESIWPQLQQHFSGSFVVRSPNQIFSPNEVAHDLKLKAEGRTVSFKFHQKFSAAQLNQGIFGEAEVVLRHVVRRLGLAMKGHSRLGRRFYGSIQQKAQAELEFVAGFHCAMHKLGAHGPALHLDILHLPLRKPLTVLSFMAQNFQRVLPPTGTADAPAANQRAAAAAANESAGDEEAHLLHQTDPIVAGEWRRKCLFSTVVAKYTNKPYRIKAVHTDMTPQSTFSYCHSRGEKKHETMTYVQYYNAYYNEEIKEMRQPMLEAFAERSSETVMLVPELCLFTGFTDDVKKDKSTLTEMLKQAKVAPQERFASIQSVASDIKKKLDDDSDAGAARLMKSWKLSFDEKPLAVDARVMEPLKVSFTDPDKQYAIEDGTFQRWMRNGLACPTRLEEWLFVYPDTVCPFVDIWLRSLRDIAQVAFIMQVVNPIRVICSQQHTDMEQELEKRLKPTTQLVLVILSGSSSRKAYQLLKSTTIRKFPCITQVVKSETMQKRNSIAAVLSRIVLQINAKMCGPLWHIQLKDALTDPLMKLPTMVIGLDVFKNYDTGTCEQYMGFAASLNTGCSQYYSTAAKLEPGRERPSMARKLQEAFRSALAEFSERNEMLPEHIIVFRNGVSDKEWAHIVATEVEPLKSVMNKVADLSQRPNGEPCEPKLTFVVIAKSTGVRFFNVATQDSANIVKNPEPGSVVDSLAICRPDFPNFYLCGHMANKGSALPVHYLVLADDADVPLVALQSFCYRLTFLYYNHTGSVKIPAPAQYAKKIAHLIGTTTQEEPDERLRCTFFYL